jgi:hypothetical protein
VACLTSSHLRVRGLTVGRAEGLSAVVGVLELMTIGNMDLLARLEDWDVFC